jgi:hypothetical protein
MASYFMETDSVDGVATPQVSIQSITFGRDERGLKRVEELQKVVFGM